MIVQKIAHCTDSILTQEMARIGLEDYGVVVTWYTNQNNKQSVVHSHPYHEIVLPISGSNVLYAFQGSLYTLHPGEMVFFPAEIYHSGRYTVTDIVSNRQSGLAEEYRYFERGRCIRLGPAGAFGAHGPDSLDQKSLSENGVKL